MKPNPKRRSIWPSIAVAAATFAFGGVIWFAYHQSPSAGGIPPLVKADPGPSKVKPDNPGGQGGPPEDTIVYEHLMGRNDQNPAVERLLPPPEVPVVRPPPVDAVEAPKPAGPSSIDDLIKAAGAGGPETSSRGSN